MPGEKYAVSQEGILALKTMSAAIVSSSEKIKELTGTLQTVIDDNPNTLGPHRNQLEEVIQAIDKEVKAATEPISGISNSLNKLADAYQEIIDDELGVDTGK
ncbi:MAG: hypothetical protein IKU13_01890 [Clostridia bacterium]|nr:hypothetical protein [Clostridia bacterium]MBR5265948.1 hypothetical protein [Clostridia bacterium]